MTLKLKYRVGTQHKGIRRRKSDDQPGKMRRVHPHQSSPTRVIPNHGRLHRHPTGPPGSARGRREVLK